MAFCIFGFLAIANELRERSEALFSNVLQLGDLLRLSIYFLPSLVPYIIPIAFFFGMLMALGNLTQQGEISAVQAAGVSLRRLIFPVVLVGAALTGACFLIQDRLQPWTMNRAFDLIQTELPDRATILTLEAGVMHSYEDWRVYFLYKDPLDKTLHDVEIVKPDRDGEEEVYHAAYAQLERQSEGSILALYDVRIITPESLLLQVESVRLPIPSATIRSAANRVRLGSNLNRLLELEKERTADYIETGSYRTSRELLKQRREIANRLSLPFATVTMAMVGAPLGARPARARRGSRARLFALGLAILAMYYVLRTMLSPSSLFDLRTAILLVQIPNVLLFILGLMLIWRIDRA